MTGLPLILRHDERIIRDCWWEIDDLDPKEKILAIRQTRFSADGSTTCKVIRLTTEELLRLPRP